MRTRQINSEVLYPDEDFVDVAQSDVASLKSLALRNDRRRVRLCAHRDTDEPLHEMLIVHTDDTYVRPHKHLGKAESMHIIEGRADMIAFDEAGTIGKVIRMGDYSSGLIFYHRASEAFYHSLLIRSEVLVFHETTSGPFRREDTVFAPWAPQDTDDVSRLAYMDELARAVARFTSS